MRLRKEDEGIIAAFNTLGYPVYLYEHLNKPGELLVSPVKVTYDDKHGVVRKAVFKLTLCFIIKPKQEWLKKLI
jgi:hypothetical protein